MLQSLTRDDLLAALICVASNNNVSQPLVSSVILDIYCKRDRGSCWSSPWRRFRVSNPVHLSLTLTFGFQSVHSTSG